MKINSKTVRNYSMSFDDDALHSVDQFLEVFNCCDELREHVRDVLNDRQEQLRITAEDRKKRAKVAVDKMRLEYEQQEQMASEDGKFPGEPKQLPTIGFCPKCKSKMGGAWVANCEMNKTGRFFIRECGSCDYYAEVFKKRNKYYEVEGG
jgi:hypothetical protein